MIGSKPTSLELFLARTIRPGSRDHSAFRIFNRERLSEPDPDAYVWFLYALGLAWVWLYILFALAMAGLGALSNAIHLVRNGTLVSVFVFGSVFAVAGAWDAVWRVFVVWPARRRYLRAGRTLDEAGHRLMKRARFNDGTLLIQLAAGFFFSFHLWSRI